MAAIESVEQTVGQPKNAIRRTADNNSIVCTSIVSTSELGDMIGQSNKQHENNQESRTKKSAYVETSLDDLSFQDSSTSSDLDEEAKRPSGSGQSDDEENERRLLVQLQTEQRNKLRAQQQQQQELESQRQAAFERAQEQEADRQLEDELAPQVPVRRSSRVAERSQQAQQVQQHQHHHHLQQQQQQQQPQHLNQPRSSHHERDKSNRPFDPRRELPRPLLAGAEQNAHRWRAKSDSSKRRAISRPTQPPPPPPPLPPLIPSLPTTSGASLPPLTRPKHAPKSPAPKNIWSPSSSSATTGSPSICAPDLELEARHEQQQQHELRSRPTPQQAVVLAGHEKGGPRTVADNTVAVSSPSSPNTIVERRHLDDGPESTRSIANEPIAVDPPPGEPVAAAAAAEEQEFSIGNTANYDDDDDDDDDDHDEAQNKQTSKTNHNSNQRGDHNDGSLERGVSSHAAAAADPSLANTAAAASWESRQGELGATPVERQQPSSQGQQQHQVELAAGLAPVRAGLRSMSVSSKRTTDKAATSMAVHRHSTNLRSFSLASSTLPAGASSITCAELQQSDGQQPTSTSRYWTLPSGGAVSSSPIVAQPAASGASEATRPLEKRPAQQEQLYSISSKRKSADVAARQKQPKQKQHDQSRRNSEARAPIAQHQLEMDDDQLEASTDANTNRNTNTNTNTNTKSSARDEWFKHMYKRMHRPTTENTLLMAVNSAPPDSRDLIEVKLKSPKRDHRMSPTYYASEDDFEQRHDRNSVSPTFKPGNISDYLPGQSSISQHERNLILYHKLIDHIDRVFSSVLAPELETATSRSTNTLQLSSRPARSSHQQLYSRSLKRQQQISKSGPQTPVTFRDQTSSLNRNQIRNKTGNDYHTRHRRIEPLKGDAGNYSDLDDESPHEKRCVFNRLLKQPDQQQQQQLQQATDVLYHCRHNEDPRKQYVAVQQGHDIPLKGLRKPAPQPNIYKVGPIPPHFSLYKPHDLLSSTEAQQAHRDLRRPNRLTEPAPARRHAKTTGAVAAAALNGNQDDVYRDFESIYESMRRYKPTLIKQQVNRLNCEAAFETEQLAKSLAQVEEALQRARCSSPGQQLPSPSASSTYGGKLISVSSSRLQSALANPEAARGDVQSPMLSIETASEMTTRADSCNTNQSYQMCGPALVEEMTLSDLEDEISLSLMETSQRNRLQQRAKSYYLVDSKDGQHLLRASRSRNPLPVSVSIRMAQQAGPTAAAAAAASASGSD